MDVKYVKIPTMAAMSLIPAVAMWYLNKDEIALRQPPPPPPSLTTSPRDVDKDR